MLSESGVKEVKARIAELEAKLDVAVEADDLRAVCELDAQLDVLRPRLQARLFVGKLKVSKTTTLQSQNAQSDPQPRDGFTSSDEEEIEDFWRYKAMAAGVIRTGAELDSNKCGKLTEGMDLIVYEQKHVDGTLRVRFSGGWTSVISAKGKELLKLVSAPPGSENDASAEGEAGEEQGDEGEQAEAQADDSSNSCNRRRRCNNYNRGHSSGWI